MTAGGSRILMRTLMSAGALNVLEHVEEAEAFLEEIVRVVEPAREDRSLQPELYAGRRVSRLSPAYAGVAEQMAKLATPVRETACDVGNARAGAL